MNLTSIALSHIGLQEIPGPKTNPELAKFFAEFPNLPQEDETPWCSLFIYWCAKQCGLSLPPKELAPMARSWLKVGTPTDKPQVGDLAIFSRGTGASGHVGIFCNRIGDKIFVLGGNQNNSVSVQGHDAGRLLGFRVLETITNYGNLDQTPVL